MEWSDIDFVNRVVTLHTRKKKGGNLTPREVPMTDKLYEILSKRERDRDREISWVFWHRYWSRKKNDFVTGPYKDRKKIMKSLCKDAGVDYFRYHPIRHSGASVLDNENVPIGVTQSILGHENRKTTEIYLHAVGGAVRSAMGRFERAREKSHTESHTE